jgi:pentose-5-phosphate-3-epimerase
LLNLQLGLLQKDHLLINKYFTNFQQMKEKILNLLIQNKSQHLNNYLKENEEIINIFKEDLINLKKIIGEIKNYEIKK